jgi:hypothetical protein
MTPTITAFDMRRLIGAEIYVALACQTDEGLQELPFGRQRWSSFPEGECGFEATESGLVNCMMIFNGQGHHTATLPLPNGWPAMFMRKGARLIVKIGPE